MNALDGLLGRESLKEEISALEDRITRLESQLAAEEERRRKAVRKRQDAEERVNQLEDRINGLEGELAQSRDDERELSWSYVHSLDHGTMRKLLDMLEGVRSQPESLCVAGVADTPDDALSEVLPKEWPLVQEIAPCVIVVDERRVIRAMFTPPRPPEATLRWSDRFDLEREWFLPKNDTGFAIARGDLFAVGTYRDAELVFDDGFESDVMGRHSKGGFSQARFERRREEQIDTHVAQCREVLKDRQDDELIIVGDRRVVSRCSDLASATGVVDASGQPEGALRDGFRDFWTTRMYLP